MAAVVVLGSSAQASTYTLSYLFNAGGNQDLLTAYLMGTLQPDNNTVLVSSVTGVTFDVNTVQMVPPPIVSVINSYSNFISSSGVVPTVTLNGDGIDFAACVTAACTDGFLIYNSSGAGYYGAASQYHGDTSFGAIVAPFNVANYSLTLGAPEPGSMALFGIGVGAVALFRRRRCSGR